MHQVRAIWFGICIICTPLALVATRTANPPGAAARTFLQNGHSLFGLSIMMFNGWAFKDVAAAVIALYKQPLTCVHALQSDPSKCTWNGSFWYRTTWIFVQVGVAVGAVIAVFLFNEIMAMIARSTSERRTDEAAAIEHQKDREKSIFDRFARNWGYGALGFLKAQPLLLGVGYCWHKVCLNCLVCLALLYLALQYQMESENYY